MFKVVIQGAFILTNNKNFKKKKNETLIGKYFDWNDSENLLCILGYTD